MRHSNLWNKNSSTRVLLIEANLQRWRYAASRIQEIRRAIYSGVRTMRAAGNCTRGVFDQGTRLMHWMTAGLMLAVFALAFSIDLATSRAAHTAMLQLHRSVGLTVWALTLFRLAWRHYAKYPDWPSDMSQTMQVAAVTSEYALYALLLAQPILGLLQTNAHGDRVNLFFIGQLPALIVKNRPLAQQLLTAHKAVGVCMLSLIALHVSAALFHHFWRRDDTLTAMLPAAAAWRTLEPRAELARDADVLPSGNINSATPSSAQSSSAQ
jgi:superoxide oxidase